MGSKKKIICEHCQHLRQVDADVGECMYYMQFRVVKTERFCESFKQVEKEFKVSEVEVVDIIDSANRDFFMLEMSLYFDRLVRAKDDCFTKEKDELRKIFCDAFDFNSEYEKDENCTELKNGDQEK